MLRVADICALCMSAADLLHELLIAEHYARSKHIHPLSCLELRLQRCETMYQAPLHGLKEDEPQSPLVRGRPDVTSHALIKLGYDGHRTVRNEMDQHEAASR